MFIVACLRHVSGPAKTISPFNLGEYTLFIIVSYYVMYCHVISIYNNHINVRWRGVLWQSPVNLVQAFLDFVLGGLAQHLCQIWNVFFSKAAPSPSLRFQDLSQPDPNYAKVCHHAISLRNKVANWVCGSKQTILQVASLSVSALQERTQKKSRQGSKTSIWGKMEKMRGKKEWKRLKRIERVPFCLCLLCCSFLMSNHSTTCAFQFRLVRSESQAQLIRSPSPITSTFDKNIRLCSNYTLGSLGYVRRVVY